MTSVNPAQAAGFLLRAAAFALLIAIATDTTADTDLWGHVRFGLDTLHSHRLASADPYSFTSDRPWDNHEWLAELFMGAAFAAGGGAGLVALKFALFLASIWLASWSIDRRAGPGLAGALILAFTALTSAVPLLSTLRPQGFSILLFVITTAIMMSGRSRAIWALPMVFALWANFHGGWVMALGMLGVWIAVSLVHPDRTSPDRGTLVAVGLLSVAATLASPYGIGLWRFMRETLGFNRGDIVEWLPLTKLPALLVPWVITLALGALAVARRRASWAAAAACVLLAVASFRVGRMVPFFSLAVGMLLLPGLAGRDETPVRLPGWLRSAAMLAGGVVVAVAMTASGSAHRVTCLEPLPVLELDPRARAFIQANHLSGRLLVWFNWGEYAIWHLSPQLKVSMDGRRETVYSERTLDAHLQLLANAPGAKAYFDELAPDVVWLPVATTLNSQLAAWGWRQAFATPTSIVWVPAADTQMFLPPGSPLDACFPGP